MFDIRNNIANRIPTTNVETFEKLPNEDIVVSIVKDSTGKIVTTTAYTSTMVDSQLANPTNQVERLSKIKALFV